MKVIFLIQKKEGSNEILYPDDIELFSNTEIKDDKIIAEYRGKKSLDVYIPNTVPEQEEITLKMIMNKLEEIEGKLKTTNIP